MRIGGKSICMNNPKVSILIPVYNAERYLARCLDSVVAQTLKEIEIICINDGSTDDTTSILCRYQRRDGRIVIIDKSNSGYGDSMNRGLLRASGEYVAILESDDFVKSTMLEELYTLAVRHDADLVKSDFYYYYSAGHGYAIKAGKIGYCNGGKPFTARERPSVLGIQATIWSAIYRRSFLLDYDIKFLCTPGASYQDASFAFKSFVLARSIVFTPKAYVYYRQDNPISSINSADKVFAICAEFDELTSFLDKNPEIKEFANTVKLINQYRCYLWNARRVDSRHRDLFLSEFAETFRRFKAEGVLGFKFYWKVGYFSFNCLLNDPRLYRHYVDKLARKSELRAARRRRFSVRIRHNMVSIVLFGKHVVGIG